MKRLIEYQRPRTLGRSLASGLRVSRTVIGCAGRRRFLSGTRQPISYSSSKQLILASLADVLRVRARREPSYLHIPSIDKSSTVLDALHYMNLQQASSLLVTEQIPGRDEVQVRDIFTEKDVMLRFPEIGTASTVSDVKHLGRGVATATPDAIVLDALRFMLVSGIRHLPIVMPGTSHAGALRSVYAPESMRSSADGADNGASLALDHIGALTDTQSLVTEGAFSSDAPDSFEAVLAQVLAGAEPGSREERGGD